MSSMFPGQFKPVPSSFQSLALDNVTPQGLAPLPTGPNGYPKYALVQALGANVNWRDDGVAPTAADGGGMFVNSSDAPQGFAGNLFGAEFISTSASGSTLLISYYY